MPFTDIRIPDTSTIGAAITIPTGSTVIATKGGIDYTPVQKTEQYNSAQTNATFWQPASGKKWYMTDLIISTSTHSDITLIDTNSTLTIFQFGDTGGVVSNFQTPMVASAANGTLRVATTTSTCSVIMTGYEA